MLYHILRRSLAGIPLKEVARKTCYSPMMTTKVKDELEALQLCKSVRSGRSRALEFMGTGRTLWDRVNPYMISPVKRTRWARWEHPSHPGLLAGLSALSRQTMIARDAALFQLPQDAPGLFFGLPGATTVEGPARKQETCPREFDFPARTRGRRSLHAIRFGYVRTLSQAARDRQSRRVSSALSSGRAGGFLLD